jgi:hypothetical protein
MRDALIEKELDIVMLLDYNEDAYVTGLFSRTKIPWHFPLN